MDYKNNRTKVKIICPIHGIFEQSPTIHLNARGCPLCGGTKKLTNEEFIKRSSEVHNNKYDYSLVNYINLNTVVDIICKKHGKFKQKPYNHMHHKSGCPLCANTIKGKIVKLNNDIFIEKSKKIHGDKYDYSMVNYIGTNKCVKIICKKHGIFNQIPNSHLNGKGCPICKNSKGENFIMNYLIKNKIKFKRQQTFDDCLYKIKLRFDFYLQDLNICIEYNGIQHYKPIKYFGGIEKFNINKKRFLSKEEYCHRHNIKLIIIKYDDNIENILNSLFYPHI